MLTDEQIRWFIDAYTKGEVADEQAAALLMAIVSRGMEPARAGDVDRGHDRRPASASTFRGVGRPTVDKHSTGGVGDKVSLVLAPLVAACGAAVPQLSGRGLGHTGGTLDKLESIAGLAGGAVATTRCCRSCGRSGAVICAAGAGPGAGRPQALRAARRHRARSSRSR